MSVPVVIAGLCVLCALACGVVWFLHPDHKRLEPAIGIFASIGAAVGFWGTAPAVAMLAPVVIGVVVVAHMVSRDRSGESVSLGLRENESTVRTSGPVAAPGRSASASRPTPDQLLLLRTLAAQPSAEAVTQQVEALMARDHAWTHERFNVTRSAVEARGWASSSGLAGGVNSTEWMFLVDAGALVLAQLPEPRAAAERPARAFADASSAPMELRTQDGPLHESKLSLAAGAFTSIDVRVLRPGTLRITVTCDDPSTTIWVCLGYADCPSFEALRTGGCRILVDKRGRLRVVVPYEEEQAHVFAPPLEPGLRRVHIVNEGAVAGQVAVVVGFRDEERTPQRVRANYITTSALIGDHLQRLRSVPTGYDLPSRMAIAGVVETSDDVAELNALRAVRNRLHFSNEPDIVPTADEERRQTAWARRLASAPSP